ncbi:MAG: helix-turn-helix transcriptional regulator [Eggerthellaceae bacterium]|nr:helix-turn-helix transcriptional regulator [Eggerthellaceae bacterium]
MPRVRSNHESIGLRKGLASLWPGFGFLGLGLYLAWMLLLSDTCAWVSDIDQNGNALTNGHLLVTLSSTLGLSAAATLALLSVLRERADAFLRSRWSIAAIGVLGAVGAVCLIGSGPYFIGGPFGLDIKGLFSAGAVVCGVTAGLLLLECARAFEGIEPYRVLVYCLLMQLLAVAVYSFVMVNDLFRPYEGGPPASGIAALAVLPLLAALALSMDARKPASAKPAPACVPSAEVVSRKGAFSEAAGLVRFFVMLFVFSLAVSLSLGYCANSLTVFTLQAGMRISVDFRLLFAVVLLVLVVGRLERVPLASLSVLIAAVIAVALALFPLIGLDSTITYVVVNVASSIFDVMVWCMLALIAFRRSFPAVNVFGLGLGASMAGNGLGWLAASSLMPTLVGAKLDAAVYVALAFVALALTVLVFSGRDFGRLFGDDAERVLSLRKDEGMKDLVERAEPSTHNRPWRDACGAVCDEASLSEREREIFMLVSVGHTAEAIAEELCISANTVRTHIHNIYGKLEVHSRQELINRVKAKM